MSLTRVATWKDSKKVAVLLEVSGKQLKIDHEDLGMLNTAEKIEAELSSQAAVGNVAPPRIFIHINRDKSLALATGAAPDTWPEDVGLDG